MLTLVHTALITMLVLFVGPVTRHLMQAARERERERTYFYVSLEGTIDHGGENMEAIYFPLACGGRSFW